MFWRIVPSGIRAEVPIIDKHDATLGESRMTGSVHRDQPGKRPPMKLVMPVVNWWRP